MFLDIAVLNEVDFDSSWSGRINQAEYLAREAGLVHRVEQRNIDLSFPFFAWQFGNAILSRFPLSDARLVDFPAYSRWEAVLAGKKQGVVCTATLPSGQQLRVLAVHLCHRSESVRIASADNIEQIAAESRLPLVAAGDFNSTPVDSPGAEPDTSGRTALSLLIDTGTFHVAGLEPSAPAALTFPATNPDRRIDWIMASGPARLLSSKVANLQFSDHRPVVATLRIDQ